MSIITIDAASERYSRTDENFRTQAFLYKKKNGVLPNWYVIGGGVCMIDTDAYEHKTNLERKAWIYATEKLYWILTSAIGFNSKYLSEKFSEMGGHSVAVWENFIRNNLFNLPPEYVGDKKKSMRLEFVQLGTKLVYDLIKSGDLDHLRYNNIKETPCLEC